MRAGFALLAILVSAAAQRPAHARADDAEDARRLFEQAGEARRSGRLVDARDLLRRSLALHPSRATAFNLATTLREAGQMREALTTLERLRDHEFGALAPEQQTEVERMIERTRAELATLRIELEGGGTDSVEIRVDGARVGAVAGTGHVDHVLDAGRHVVSAHAPDGRRSARDEVDAARGERVLVRLVLPPAHAPATRRALPAHAPSAAERDGGSSTTWIWIGAGVIAAGAITAGIWLALDSGDEDAMTLPAIHTLRF